MKLTIASTPIAIPADATLSMERSSPFVNDDTGSFSYPFPVPRLPNQQALGWPGKLQRVGEIPDKSFILEDSGLQILQGEVDYDEITNREIGIILQSGMTEFWAKMEGKRLTDIDFGYEDWFGMTTTLSTLNAKFTEWDDANIGDNGKYVVAPFAMRRGVNNELVYGNKCHGITGTLTISQDETINPGWGYYMLQFRVSFVIKKLFEAAGYTVTLNDFSTSIFSNVVMFSKPIRFIYNDYAHSGTINISPGTFTLSYKNLMPDIDVVDFMDEVKKMLALFYDINERQKTVNISFKKSVFDAQNLVKTNIPELAGWAHKEKSFTDGFALRYQSQDSGKDTEEDYTITETVVSTLPEPTEEGEVYHVSTYNRDYVVVKDSDDVLSWERIGRLKGYVDGNGKNETEIKVIVPTQTVIDVSEGPLLEITVDINSDFTSIDKLIFSVYHGLNAFGSNTMPFINSEQWSIGQQGYPAIYNGMSLAPDYLYASVYETYLNWKTYRAREFTKYIQLSLSDLLRLSFGKRYVINGVEIILSKINYELPHHGTVKIEGFTA